MSKNSKRRNDYAPYGNPTDPGPGAPRFGFTSEWWQDNLDLLYLRARWYAPETGTFLSVDPVESEPHHSTAEPAITRRKNDNKHSKTK